MHLDGFQSKYTQAWDDLTRRVVPKVFPHGDECNPFINIADLISFMTNIKLGAQTSPERRKLTPENVRDIWNPYSFGVDTHYFDPSIQYKLAWRSEDLIDLKKYFARPMIYVMVDAALKEHLSPRKLKLRR